MSPMPPTPSLYEQAKFWVCERDEFSRQRFQRVLRVGFITRDRLLNELIDAGIIRHIDRDRFEVIA